MTDMNIEVRNLEQTSKDDSKFMNFKLTVRSSDMNTVMQPDFWPTGVCVRKYYNRNQNYQ